MGSSKADDDSVKFTSFAGDPEYKSRVYLVPTPNGVTVEYERRVEGPGFTETISEILVFDRDHGIVVERSESHRYERQPDASYSRVVIPALAADFIRRPPMYGDQLGPTLDALIKVLEAKK